MKLPVALTIAMIPTLSMANCIPPWQTQFACDIPERNARVEFCRIAEPRLHPGRAELYYTFVTGTRPAELYFEAESYIFSTKEMDADRPSEITSGIGYPRGNYVYAFFITEDRRRPGNVRDAEVRAYSSVDAFSNSKRSNDIIKLRCERSSIVADFDSIRP
ncbi:hypothetical protein EBE87_27670 [Pseudoroseomonas wenyumeiae]|uniref:Uncharacterized protein n=1 Tax=Teichococcus wenyumeiae TaxID=2478470 RepID=A0A3A9J6E4_9PROT|nr:hypothetical protein [Pseudoroseomonas wenyumeiae]RKK01241.1 hypothetical protein D6Z83_25980 [Pseudoroseomonas wenyumeiae]RMI14589.1 hypothetical protein EBE87_27670 [Pseudoroseomonas wenyumeiae]